MCTIGMSALSLFGTLVVLNIHHQSTHKPMSDGMRTAIFGILAKCVGLGDLNTYHAPGISYITNAPDDNAEQIPKPMTNNQYTLPPNSSATKGVNSFHGLSDELTGLPVLVNKLDTLVTKVREDDVEGSRRQEWVSAARVLDRFLLYIFLVITVTVAVTLLGVYPANRPEITGPIRAHFV